MDTDEYDERCRVATQAQGLEPVIAFLRERGYEYEVCQTGGFTMVVFTPGEQGGACLGITVDYVDASGRWLVVHYVDADDDEGVPLSHGTPTDGKAAIIDWYEKREAGS